MRAKRRRKKRSTILRAATLVFSRDGYHKARMDDIAITAGMGKGTIYQYFSGKQELFQEMIKEGFNLYLGKLEEDISEGNNYYDAFKRIIDFSFNFMQKNVDISKVIISHPSMIDEKTVKWIRDKKQEIIQLIVTIINKYKKQGEFREIDPMIAAHCFFAMIIFPIAENVFHRRKFNEEVVANGIVDVFLNGLVKK